MSKACSDNTVHRLAHDVSRTVRSSSTNVRVGQSLKDMLVSSSFASPECPREVNRRKTKRRGRPVKCRRCEISMSDGLCMSQNVVYSIFDPFVKRSMWEMCQGVGPVALQRIQSLCTSETLGRALLISTTPTTSTHSAIHSHQINIPTRAGSVVETAA